MDNTIEQVKVERNNLDNEVKELTKKYPGIDLFKLTIPYSSGYILRKQTLKDVRDVTEIVANQSKRLSQEIETKHSKELTEYRAKVKAKTEAGENIDFNSEEFQLSKEIQSDIAKNEEVMDDLLNYENFKRCILYPYNIKEMIDSENIPSGDAIIIADTITKISGLMVDEDRIVIEEI